MFPGENDARLPSPLWGGAGGGGKPREERSPFFFEKKNQKTFPHRFAARPTIPSPAA